MRRFAAISKLASAATVVALFATTALYASGSESWRSAFAVVLATFALRVLVMAWAAALHALPWSRLLLPGILLIEGIGLTGGDAATLWQVRLGSAIGLELVFVAVAIRELRRASAGDEPIEARLARAFRALLPPRVAALVAFELVLVGSALRFAIGGWRREVPKGFSYHRESALRLFLHVLPLLAVGDVLLIELVLVPHAAMWLRGVIHGLAIYGLIWLVGLYASLRARPHTLEGDRLVLHRGLLRRLALPVSEIAAIDVPPSFADDWKLRAYRKGAIRIDVPGPPTLELRLRTAARPIGMFGEGAARTRVLVSVDDPGSFKEAVTRAMAWAAHASGGSDDQARALRTGPARSS